MKINITYPSPRRHRSVATSMLADAFGITNDGPPLVIARNLNLPLRRGQRIAITGPSGSGKSSILATIGKELIAQKQRAAPINNEKLPSRAVIDAIPLPFHEAVKLLTSCGLAEPTLLMRSPAELSEGQCWRFRLALTLSRKPDWILIDEFAATLDPILARIVATNLRRQSLRQRCGLVVATCHTAPVEDLDPDLHIKCNLDGHITIYQNGNTLQQCPPSQTNSTSPQVPKRTGRTSLAGITAQNNSDPSA